MEKLSRLEFKSYQKDRYLRGVGCGLAVASVYFAGCFGATFGAALTNAIRTHPGGLALDPYAGFGDFAALGMLALLALACAAGAAAIWCRTARVRRAGILHWVRVAAAAVGVYFAVGEMIHATGLVRFADGGSGAAYVLHATVPLYLAAAAFVGISLYRLYCRTGREVEPDSHDPQTTAGQSASSTISGVIEE